jgi:predicted glycosyltransferase/predicted transcriptional regulator
MTRPRQVKKIWIAMSTPFQANFFAPLIKELENEYEFLVMARDHDRIASILQAKKIDYMIVGKHGGRELVNKLEAYAKGIQEILPIVEREKPDLLLTERWPEAVRVAFGLDIPAWALFYDERERHVNQMVFPLASKIFAPRFYTFQDLYQNGVTDPEKVTLFNGFHTCYLKDEPILRGDPFGDMGVEKPVVFVRPEPEFASFFTQHQPILEKTVELLVNDNKAGVVVLPRTDSQRAVYSKIGATILEYPIQDNPVAHADVALGAAETMLMEAFILGKPVVSSIYWTPSKPVIELHRHINHSTEPRLLASYVNKFIDDEDERNAFKERASLLVNSMDNPVKIMINEIRSLNQGENEQESTRRRSQMEILIDIIQAVSFRPMRPTHIMRSANISYNELKKIIETLERKGLISTESTLGGKFYQATEEGLKVLENYKTIRERLFK